MSQDHNSRDVNPLHKILHQVLNPGKSAGKKAVQRRRARPVPDRRVSQPPGDDSVDFSKFGFVQSALGPGFTVWRHVAGGEAEPVTPIELPLPENSGVDDKGDAR